MSIEAGRLAKFVDALNVAATGQQRLLILNYVAMVNVGQSTALNALR